MDFASLHDLLRSTYDEMMPLCAQMSGIAKGIAGLGALFYIALRVWASIARAEPIDVFPLLRPFVLGFCIMFFPTVVLGTMNAVLSPVVQGTEAMVHQQENTLAQLVKRRDKLQEAAYLKNPETAYLVSNEKFDEKIEEMGIIGPEDAVTIAGMYAERAAYQTKQWVMKLFRDFTELLYNAAGLIIDTLRTFILIVPEFGLSNSPFSFDDFDIKRRLFGQETICGHGCHKIRGKSSDAPVARVFNLNDVLQFVVHRLDQRPFPQ